MTKLRDLTLPRQRYKKRNNRIIKQKKENKWGLTDHVFPYCTDILSKTSISVIYAEKLWTHFINDFIVGTGVHSTDN